MASPIYTHTVQSHFICLCFYLFHALGVKFLQHSQLSIYYHQVVIILQTLFGAQAMDVRGPNVESFQPETSSRWKMTGCPNLDPTFGRQEMVRRARI